MFAEDRRPAASVPAARADRDQLGAALLRFADDLDAGAAAAGETGDRAHAVRLDERDGVVEQLVGLHLELGQVRVEGRDSGTSSTCTTAILAPRSSARRAAATSASSDSFERTTGTTIVRYSTVSEGPSTNAGRAHGLATAAAPARRR